MIPFSLQLLLATFFNLISVVAVCVGLALGVADLPYLRGTGYWVDTVCSSEETYGYRSWEPTRNPRDDWRLEECRRRIMNLLVSRPSSEPTEAWGLGGAGAPRLVGAVPAGCASGRLGSARSVGITGQRNG